MVVSIRSHDLSLVYLSLPLGQTLTAEVLHGRKRRKKDLINRDFSGGLRARGSYNYNYFKYKPLV